MAHQWTFQRAGGFDQVVIATADDLRNLKHLDQKLWVALACPVKGNELDEKTLALVDVDGDGRIRAPDLLEAIAWCDRTLVDLASVLDGSDALKLANLADGEILASAKRILKGLDRTEASEITVAESSDAKHVLDQMPFNGDGLVPAESGQTDEAKLLLQQILDTIGGREDRSLQQGVGQAEVDAFFTALADFDTWWRRAEDDEDTVVPLGADTAPAVEAFVAVKDKVEDYFTRCRLAAFDPRAIPHLVGAEARWEALAQRGLSRTDDDIAAFPLAKIGPDRPLSLRDGLNPAWVAKMQSFVTRAVTPLLGSVDELSSEQWTELGERFAAYETWLAEKQGAAVEPLGIDRIRELLGSDLKSELEALIARDESRRPEAEALEAVDRATRYNAHLHQLVVNFVNFRDFYRRDAKAIFQAGVLYLDARSCDLVMRVADVNKHAATASSSYAYLAYCACTRKATGETCTLLAAFTDGDSDFLSVGRNGLYYDRQGRDWDATIVKVVEQPISIRAAFWAPYKRAVKFVSDQLEQFAEAQDKASSKLVDGQISGTVPPKDGAAAAAPSFDIARFAGIFAAVGLALGFIVSAMTMLLTGFLSLRLWQMPLAILAVMLLISGPSMVLAAFKLRLRNLAPLLDANGWAINSRARINIPFGRSLTQMAHLPEGSRKDRRDPFRERGGRTWLWVLLVALVCGVALAWDMGLSAWWTHLVSPPDPVETQVLPLSEASSAESGSTPLPVDPTQ